MPSWVVGVVGTFVLSLLSAYGFLWLRCRGVGPLFGPRARGWAFLIVVATALVSTGLGLLLVAASHHIRAAYVGLIVPSGLWLTTLIQRDRHLVPKPLAARLTMPLGRLYDRMGDDMEDWCDTRLRAAAEKPQWISAAAKYYYDQVEGRIKDKKAREELDRWRESIVHKISIVRLISLDTTPERLQESLYMHPATQNTRKYDVGDPERLRRRLEAEALNEMHLFLAHVYQLGYHKLLIYPFRPGTLQPETQPV